VIVKLRWIRHHVSEYTAIKRMDQSWFGQSLRRVMSHRSARCLVAEGKFGEVIGYAVFRLDSDRLSLGWLFVSEEYRRRGVGSAIVRRLEQFLQLRRESAETWVSEYDLDSQLFLGACGWTAVEQQPNKIKFRQTLAGLGGQLLEFWRERNTVHSGR